MSRQRKKALFALELVLLAVFAPSPTLRFDGKFVTLYGICIAISALLAVILFEQLRLRTVKRPKDGPIAVIFRVDALELALCCIPCALVGARLLYVAMRPGYYLFDVGLLHVLCVWEGGFLLWGAVFGSILAAMYVAKREKADAAKLLDQMAAPGLCMIALCRMAEFFAGEGLGPWIESPFFMRFPFAAPNFYGEWQMAVFLFEALSALLMLAAVLCIEVGKGKRIFAALVFYACAQVVFESLRMDNCLRIGFVRVSQVISALVILAMTYIRAYRVAGSKVAIQRGAVVLICAALIGGMEWALDKTQVHNGLIYGGMALVSVLMAANAYCKRKDNIL